ncbi:MAG: basic amino acid ABC transporter substrate-binding protein [Actinobacteria bacterium]|nr:basic amino acid ABC transporter substrate-binding protein [Actinomycetota bacterium]
MSIGVALVALFAILATACNKGTSVTPATGSSSAGTTAPAVQTLEAGKLQVASCLDYKPFEYYDKQNNLVGFDVEITQAIADRLGLQVVWVKANFDTIFTALAVNKFDMVAAASTITPEREKAVNFSDPYFNSEQGFTVNTDKTPSLTSTDGLASGDTVAVQKGTTGQKWAQDNLAPKGIQLRTFDLAPDMFTALQAGQVQGVVNDAAPSAAEVADRPGLQVVQLIDTNEHYGLAVSKDNPALLAAINGALTQIVADGTYKQIFDKYFPGTPLPAEFQPTG